ncbi:phage/plasmid replication protein [Leptospira sp. B5-022]|uniref:phage/plasmid replication domain-containing protein n=1 Tax=unclassified Leptospira TaxID=2633828 RepID=UPI0002BE9FB7|nr:phage/plasmid replication protein [Leptospira sp. B5-022]EMK01237.1 hypothetical protein LEP1GSC192_1171 [Leptospira sp. B5-022]MCR1795455.1 hypothetical protein [Leptospira sp. id769339]
MYFKTTQDPYSYLGIDTVVLFTKSHNVSKNSDLFKPKKYKNKKGKEVIAQINNGVRVEYRAHSDWKKEYWIDFSLSELYNGYNFSSDTPLDNRGLYFSLITRLNEMGIFIRDWNKVQVSRIDIFRNIKLLNPYSQYLHLLRMAEIPRNKTKFFKSSVYIETNSQTLIFYDKKEQLANNKRIDIDDDVLRIELRLMNAGKVKDIFDSNFLYAIRESLEDAYNSYIRDTLNYLKEIESIADRVPLDCSDMKTALRLYYAGKRNIDRLVDETIDALRSSHNLFLNDGSRKPKGHSNFNEAIRKQKERISKKKKKILRTAVLMNDYLTGEGGLAQELIESILETQVKVAKFPIGPIYRKSLAEHLRENALREVS